MELYYIRHGQSLNNANWGQENFQDVPDPKLTDLGHEQAQVLADFLSKNQTRNETIEWNSQNEHGFGLTHIYTSLMLRAVQTAAPIAKALNLPLVAWPEIHETGGIFSRTDGERLKGLPGENRTYYQRNYPDLLVPDWLDEDGWWNRPFEERSERKPRAESVWNELLKRHGDQAGRPEHRVAIISHGGFFNYLLTSAMGIPFPELDEKRHNFWFLMNNCGISRMDFKRDQVLICYINRHEFLSSELIT